MTPEDETNEDKTQWFALSVVPRKEKVTAQTLRAKGYEEFLPLYTEKRNWSDRVKPVQLPLFPGYVFCRLDPQVRLPILRVPSVNQIVGFGKVPHPIEDAEIHSLQAICRAGVQAVPCPYLTAGAKVTIHDGPLKGVEGLLVQDAVEASDARLVVSVTLLQRSVAVEVDREWISPVRIYTNFAGS
jgi:transcription antitermination factor NusG